MLRIEIGLAADQGYFCGLLATAGSIAIHARQDVELRYNILDGGICEKDWAYFQERIRHFHSKSSFNRIPVDEKMFEKYPAWNGNRMAYARLLLPETLKDVDWLVYCDVDFTWMRDIAELWEEREDGIALIGTKDGADWTLDREEKWFKKHGYPFDREKYFCSGLCFMNLEEFRKHNLIAKCQEVMSHDDIQYPDQAALNVATWGRTKLVPQVWQRFTEVVTQEEIDKGVVIHHAGEVPWKKLRGPLSMLSDTMLIWHKMNAKIRGISTWASLRTYFLLGEIIYHRTLVYICRCPGIRQALRWGLRAIKHPGVWSLLDIRSRPFLFRLDLALK